MLDWTRSTVYRLLILIIVLGAAIGLTAGGVLIAPYDLFIASWAVEDTPEFTVPGGVPEEGQRALREYGCIACHTIPGVKGKAATVGPPLTEWAKREYIAGTLTNTPENLIAWIKNPQAIEPGTAMPTLGVTDADARDMAAYLYTLD